jgi:TolB protein
MDTRNNAVKSETDSIKPANRPWLALGGLAVVLMTLALCGLVAMASVGGALWLRNARTTTPPALAPAVPSPATTADPTPDAGPQDTKQVEAASNIPALAVESAIDRIAFVDSAGRLGTVAPDGHNGRLLTQTGASYRFPAWSPDGRQIAAVGVDGSEGGVYAWVDEEDAPRNTLFASSMRPPIYLYWSPDSRQVSFLANDRSSLGLWLAATDGSAPARQIASGQPFYWDWSQSGDQLFVHSGGIGRNARLAFLDAGNEQTGENVASPGLFQAPGISRDGRYLAYGQDEGESFVVTIEEQASGQRTTAPHVGLAALGWSPTTQHLAWTSPRADQLTFAGPLRIMDAPTGEVTTLVQDTVVGFFWSPDGQRIAYLTPTAAADNPGAARPAGLAALSPAPEAQRGRLSFRLWVVDVASGQQRLLSTFRPSEIFLNQFIPFFDQYALSHRLWSPNSDAIVLPMLDNNGESGIYVVSLESGNATRIASGSMAFWSWR